MPAHGNADAELFNQDKNKFGMPICFLVKFMLTLARLFKTNDVVS